MYYTKSNRLTNNKDIKTHILVFMVLIFKMVYNTYSSGKRRVELSESNPPKI